MVIGCKREWEARILAVRLISVLDEYVARKSYPDTKFSYCSTRVLASTKFSTRVSRCTRPYLVPGTHDRTRIEFFLKVLVLNLVASETGRRGPAARETARSCVSHSLLVEISISLSRERYNVY
jgi:hypothetical protein